MNASEHLAQELDKALNGGAWHGPSLREALEGVDLAAAVQRPIPEAHSIAELVHHTTTWQDVVRRRLGGETPQVSDAENWPPAPPADETAWQGTLRRLFDSGRELHAVVRAFPVEQLHEKRPGIDDTWYAMISGELQHLTYHAGQVVILRKPARVHAA